MKLPKMVLRNILAVGRRRLLRPISAPTLIWTRGYWVQLYLTSLLSFNYLSWTDPK